ncbi:hypothetical protein D3C87_1575860 [compost metagenome]
MPAISPANEQQPLRGSPQAAPAARFLGKVQCLGKNLLAPLILVNLQRNLNSLRWGEG